MQQRLLSLFLTPVCSIPFFSVCGKMTLEMGFLKSSYVGWRISLLPAPMQKDRRKLVDKI